MQVVNRRFISATAAIWLLFSATVLLPVHDASHGHFDRFLNLTLNGESADSDYSHSEDCQLCRLNGQMHFFVERHVTLAQDCDTDVLNILESIVLASNCDLSFSLRAPPASFSL